MRAGTKTIIEWPTLALLAATYAVWATGTLIWPMYPLVAVLLTAIAIVQHSSLQHEALHGHPFRNARLNEVVVFPALALFIPYRRFQDTHLQHHFDPALTDPYDDPESNYRDPAVWQRLSPVAQKVLMLNNTLAGRMLLGPLIGTVKFVVDDFALVGKGDRKVVQDWVLHAFGVLIVVLWITTVGAMPGWAYLASVYLALSILRIRTFLEHRAHEASRARTVIIEDRGPLAILFLNNNLHVVHHMHPQVPWYNLPGLYAARKAHFQRRNEGYVYRNYAQIFRAYFLNAKDPVPHPIWPVKKMAQSDDC